MADKINFKKEFKEALVEFEKSNAEKRAKPTKALQEAINKQTNQNKLDADRQREISKELSQFHKKNTTEFRKNISAANQEIIDGLEEEKKTIIQTSKESRKNIANCK